MSSVNDEVQIDDQIEKLFVHGAYGRQYESWDAAKSDWLGGRDFKIFEGPYFSIRDFLDMAGMYQSIVFLDNSGGLTYLCLDGVVRSGVLAEVAA